MPNPYRILLLEDHDPLRAALLEALESWGHEVHATGRGQDAIEVVRSVPVDLTLLDMHLPGMTGCEVLRVIRHEIRPIPAIVMSAEASPEEASLAMSMGAFRFLRKPVELVHLRASVDQLIQHHFGSS